MSKKSREAIRNNLAQAISPPTAPRKRGAHLDGLLDEYSPPELSGGEAAPLQPVMSIGAFTPDVAPPPRVAPPFDVAPSQIEQPLLQNVAPPPDVAPPQRVEATRYTSIPNDIFDTVLPTLKTVEQLVLLRLYRLTRGFQSECCTVSIGTLAKRCSIGTTAARNATQELERRGLIKRVGADLMNSNQQARGVEFEMLLPAAAPPRGVAPPRRAAPTPSAAPTPDVGNKLNTQKENTQTQMGVGVRSRFTLEDCRKYAEYLRSTGQGITNPGGYATTILRTGEADEAIAAYLTPSHVASVVDASECPDCRGTGFWYPNGTEKGVAKCKHDKMTLINPSGTI